MATGGRQRLTAALLVVTLAILVCGATSRPDIEVSKGTHRVLVIDPASWNSHYSLAKAHSCAGHVAIHQPGRSPAPPVGGHPWRRAPSCPPFWNKMWHPIVAIEPHRGARGRHCAGSVCECERCRGLADFGERTRSRARRLASPGALVSGMQAGSLAYAF